MAVTGATDSPLIKEGRFSPAGGQSAASHPSFALLWDRVLSFCGCFFSPDQVKPEALMRWSCEARRWEQSGCIHEKREGRGCNSLPHEHHSKHHTKDRGLH